MSLSAMSSASGRGALRSSEGVGGGHFFLRDILAMNAPDVERRCVSAVAVNGDDVDVNANICWLRCWCCASKSWQSSFLSSRSGILHANEARQVRRSRFAKQA
jgi:hypothetical protein